MKSLHALDPPLPALERGVRIRDASLKGEGMHRRAFVQPFNGSKKHVEGGNLQGSISTTILTRDVTSVEWELRRCDDDGTIASSMKNYLEEKGRNCKVTVNESGE